MLYFCEQLFSQYSQDELLNIMVDRHILDINMGSGINTNLRADINNLTADK